MDEVKTPPSWVVVNGELQVFNSGTITVFHKDQFPKLILEMAKALAR